MRLIGRGNAKNLKDISTLIPDIYSLLDDPKDIEKESIAELTHVLTKVIQSSLFEERTGTYLRLSNWSAPCKRQLWYKIHFPEEMEKLPAKAKLMFLIGHVCEAVLLFLAKEAGHEVKGQQDRLEVAGVEGHRDGIIDGRVVDAKSASPYSFEKFRGHRLEQEDAFGYVGQLRSYVKSSGADVAPGERNRGSFLAIQKVTGELALDTYEFNDGNLEEEILNVKHILERPDPPERAFQPEPMGAKGNLKLPTACSYCAAKLLCHPGVRGFAYSNGPVYLTRVVETPKVPEFEV